MPFEVVLDLGPTHRRIDGHRHAAREQYSKKGEIIVASRREHDAHAVAGFEPPVLQTRRHSQRSIPYVLVCGHVVITIITVEVDLRSRGMTLDVPPEHIDECFRAPRRRLGIAELDGHHVTSITVRRGPVRSPQRAQQVTGRIRFRARTSAEAEFELPLETAEELDSAQTVETEIAVEEAIEVDRLCLGPRWVDFGDEVLDNLDKPGRSVVDPCLLARFLVYFTHLCTHYTICTRSLPWLANVDPHVRRQIADEEMTPIHEDRMHSDAHSRSHGHIMFVPIFLGEGSFFE